MDGLEDAGEVPGPGHHHVCCLLRSVSTTGLAICCSKFISKQRLPPHPRSGNWATDLRAGSQFGYPLLFIILLTGIFGIILQVLALRMGIVCNKDLAVLTREWVLSLGKDKRPTSMALHAASLGAREGADSNVALPPTRKSIWARRGRLGLLWLLYFVAEAAIICTELAELVGSAIALNL